MKKQDFLNPMFNVDDLRKQISDAVKADMEARLNAPPPKRDNFVELSISEYDSVPIAEYEAFLERAKASGLDAIDLQINMGYYDGVESVLLVAVKSKP